MLSNPLILCCPLLLRLSIFPSIRVFSNESVPHIRWPKYWSFSFIISPFNEYSGLTSFRMDWSDLLAVQGTLKSVLQHHCPKASILQCSAFFIVKLSHPYMATGKTIAWTAAAVASVVSDSVRPHSRQPTRLPRPWDSPGKNTGVGCHFLLQCMEVKSESEVAQSCPTLSDPMDCSPPGSSVHGIFQARVLEWGAIVDKVMSLLF